MKTDRYGIELQVGDSVRFVPAAPRHLRLLGAGTVVSLNASSPQAAIPARSAYVLVKFDNGLLCQVGTRGIECARGNQEVADTVDEILHGLGCRP